VVPLALASIFALLFMAFGNVKDSLIVYTGVPLALTGGILSLWLRGLSFSISAGVGFIALSGVAVLNGVVMVSFISRLRNEGHPLEEAIRLGTASSRAHDGARRVTRISAHGSGAWSRRGSATSARHGCDWRNHFVDCADLARASSALSDVPP
jgi:hypothetical protein